MKIKVCGMRDVQNIREIAAIAPDYLGFIFYPESKRFAGELKDSDLAVIPASVNKTGVFVNESLYSILDKIRAFGLDAVQLHGNEDPELCSAVRETGVEVIKAFGVDEHFVFKSLEPYADFVEYFLFDTKTVGYGGSGRTFNWGVLDKYELDKPYFLSGGLNPNNIGRLKEIVDSRFYAADLNSGFETAPAIKNIEELSKAINLLRL